MANLLSLKRRIRAATNVSKTTRAMQMIATSKLKRAQDATLASRPYVEKLTSISQNLVSKLERKNLHKYMKKSDDIKNTLLIVLSPDKGLCGGLIVNLVREFLRLDLENKENLYLTVGKKVESSMAGLTKKIIASFQFGTTLPSYEAVFPIVNIINDYYLNKKVGSVKILYADFISVFSQKSAITNILPIELPEKTSNLSHFTLFEPNLSDLVPNLLKHYLEMIIYQHLLESFASEQASRMIAMQTATDNAHEIAEDLRLEYNKERQEKITNEILDISSASYTTYL